MLKNQNIALQSGQLILKNQIICVTGKNFKFKKHIENLCRNSNYKLHALMCIRKYLTVEKPKLLSNKAP